MFYCVTYLTMIPSQPHLLTKCDGGSDKLWWDGGVTKSQNWLLWKGKSVVIVCDRYVRVIGSFTLHKTYGNFKIGKVGSLTRID